MPIQPYHYFPESILKDSLGNPGFYVDDIPLFDAWELARTLVLNLDMDLLSVQDELTLLTAYSPVGTHWRHVEIFRSLPRLYLSYRGAGVLYALMVLKNILSNGVSRAELLNGLDTSFFGNMNDRSCLFFDYHVFRCFCQVYPDIFDAGWSRTMRDRLRQFAAADPNTEDWFKDFRPEFYGK